MVQFFLFVALCLMPYTSRNEPQEVVYEIFVQSFRDSNGDGIGDLRGIISKLDYIHDLGATAIWITPVHPSPSYHKYDVIDYYSIDPDFGTMADMEMLISELHKRGMKMIMDFVINHTSDQHAWFKSSSSAENNAFHDYYVWRNYDEVQDEINKKQTTFDSDNITQWHRDENRKEHYYGFFWKGMPDLNFDNPAVREEIYTIGKFWIDKGVDGFRMDAARHIYPDDKLDDTRKFWEEFTMRMRAYKPDIKIIGEVWAEPNTLKTLFKGLPSLFNFELAKSIPQLINSGESDPFEHSYTNMQQAYQNADDPFEDAIILSNHDMNRIRSLVNGDLQKAKLAASILLTLPGTPYIYYGEELGMLGVKPDQQIREPFLWGDDNFQKKCWINPQYSITPAVQPLTEQMKDPASIYHHYKKWIRLRKEHPAIASGQLEFTGNDYPKVFSYTIRDAEREYLIMHNLNDGPVTLQLPSGSQLVSDEVSTFGDFTLSVGHSAVFKMK